MIAKGRFIRGGAANTQGATAHLNAHLKYLEYRSRDEQEGREDRSIFCKDEDAVFRRDAVQDVMAHTSHRVSYHTFVLSPGDDEPVQDWQQWTRDILADLEDLQGKDLHWYAVHHSNTEHEHVHVVLAGAGEDRETGREEAVKLYPQDYQLLREAGHAHSDHGFYDHIDTILKELDRQDDVLRGQGIEEHLYEPGNTFPGYDHEEGDHDR